MEDLYSRPTLEEEDEECVIVQEGEVRKQQQTYVLVGRFLTEKNVILMLRGMFLLHYGDPKKEWRYMIWGSEIFIRVLSCFGYAKGVGGRPWTFEQSLLVYHKMEDNEDPQLVNLQNTN